MSDNQQDSRQLSDEQIEHIKANYGGIDRPDKEFEMLFAHIEYQQERINDLLGELILKQKQIKILTPRA